jgi:hypothetical protein
LCFSVSFLMDILGEMVECGSVGGWVGGLLGRSY